MKKKLTTVEFRGTKEQEAELLAIIEKYRGVQGAMMPILQQTQDVYGYLPVEAMRIIADKTGKPIEEIFGIASFYSQFSLNPKGEVAIVSARRAMSRARAICSRRLKRCSALRAAVRRRTVSIRLRQRAASAHAALHLS